MTEDFCRRAAALPNLCPQFHLSMQSGCDATLKRMNRKYDTARYLESVELLNRWFARPHWEYDYQISRIIEISESREYSDSKYLYRIEPAKEPDHSRIRLEPQFLEDGGSSGAFSFEIEGEALDMRRVEEEVLVLMDREENNIDAYSLEGRFLWNIGEKLPVHRRYDNLYEDICG